MRTVKTPSPMRSGNHPPEATFVRFVEKNARSTVRKAVHQSATIQRGFFHCVRTTTKNRIVSMVRVPVMAMP